VWKDEWKPGSRKKNAKERKFCNIKVKNKYRSNAMVGPVLFGSMFVGKAQSYGFCIIIDMPK